MTAGQIARRGALKQVVLMPGWSTAPRDQRRQPKMVTDLHNAKRRLGTSQWEQAIQAVAIAVKLCTNHEGSIAVNCTQGIYSCYCISVYKDSTIWWAVFQVNVKHMYNVKSISEELLGHRKSLCRAEIFSRHEALPTESFCLLVSG
jgi:hypothetical protein